MTRFVIAGDEKERTDELPANEGGRAVTLRASVPPGYPMHTLCMHEDQSTASQFDKSLGLQSVPS